MPLRIPRSLFARHYDRLTAGYEREMAQRKRAFLGPLTGSLVEIGPGTGANLGYLPRGVRWIGIEPNEHMHSLLRTKAEALGMEVDLRTGGADDLPLPDGSVDGVLSTLVLCSVPDVGAALAEIRRVLRPGGHFYFWEHVVAHDSRGLRLLQGLLDPLQQVFADGCRTRRDLAADIEGAGFAEVELEAYRVPKRAAPAWIRPHIIGKARR